jgi:hypothetical protein
LFDSTTAQEAYGHPQLADCLGVDDPDSEYYPQTLEKITLKLPMLSPNIDISSSGDYGDGNIGYFIETKYPEITLDIINSL